jgi:hypothetical protein
VDPVEQVEGGADEDAGGEGGGDRQQRPRPAGTPGGDEEPHRDGHIEGAEVASDVDGGPGVLAEQQRRQPGDELDDGQPRQAQAGEAAEDRARAAGGGEDASRDVGRGLGAADPHDPRRAGGGIGERAAGRATLQVVIEARPFARGELVVDPGGDQLVPGAAIHVVVVANGGAAVPSVVRSSRPWPSAGTT